MFSQSLSCNKHNCYIELTGEIVDVFKYSGICGVWVKTHNGTRHGYWDGNDVPVVGGLARIRASAHEDWDFNTILSWVGP